MSTEPKPFSIDARARLREQQRRENELLAAVLAAESRLDAHRAKHKRAVARADEDLALAQAERDEHVLALVHAAGVTRTSGLLAISAPELARLARGKRKNAKPRKTVVTGSQPADV